MSFQNPAMLWWLLALAIPIIVHLFNFRRHKILLFSNIQLLKNLQQETIRKKNLKHYVVLALRLLAIAALVLAFARPFIPANTDIQADGNNLVSVYLDNSMSMQLRGSSMSLLDEARQQALDLRNAFGMNNRYALFTNDFLPQHQRHLSHVEFEQELATVRQGAPPAKMNTLLSRERNLSGRQTFDSKMLFVFSDFQENMAVLTDQLTDTALNIFLIPSSPSVRNNIFIDSCWFESPVLQTGVSTFIHVRITNSGTEDALGIPLRLEVNGDQKALTNVDIKAASFTDVQLQFVPSAAGYQEARLSLIDFPIVFDDELFFAFEVKEAVKVLEIFEVEPNPWIQMLFEDDEQIVYDKSQKLRLDIQSLQDYDLVLLNELSSIPSGMLQSLRVFLEKGGSIALLPGSSTDGLNELLEGTGIQYAAQADTATTRVFSIEEQHPLFKDVFVKIPENADLPQLNRHYPIRKTGASFGFSLIKLLNGNDFLTQTNYGSGRIYLFTVGVDTRYTNFSRNNLFVPVFYRLAFTSARLSPLYYTLGEEVRIERPLPMSLSGNPFRLRSMISDFELIPEIRQGGVRQEIVIHSAIPEAGHYALFHGDTLVGLYAWNDNRAESLMQFTPAEQVRQNLQALGYKHVTIIESESMRMSGAIESALGGKSRHILFIWLALLFLLMEVLVLRFWK